MGAVLGADLAGSPPTVADRRKAVATVGQVAQAPPDPRQDLLSWR